MWLTFRALVQALITWWSKDRIRVPRGEGRLLRVVVGDRLIIRAALLCVHARRESIRGGMTQVTLTLTELESTDGELWYLTYTNRSPELRYGLAVAEKLAVLESSNGSEASFERCFTGETIVVKRGAESRELLHEEVCVLQRR